MSRARWARRVILAGLVLVPIAGRSAQAPPSVCEGLEARQETCRADHVASELPGNYNAGSKGCPEGNGVCALAD